MRIAVLTPTFFEFSGIDRVVQQQVTSLVQKYDVTVYCFAGDIVVQGVTVRELGLPKNPTLARIYRLFFLFAFPTRIRVSRELASYDRIHVHFYPMSVLAKDAKGVNPNLTVIEHDYGIATPSLFERFHERIYLHIFSLFAYHYMRAADKVITISHYLASVLREQGIFSEVEHLSIDKKRFSKNVSGTALRKRLGIGNAPLCFYLGRVSPHKGVHLLIEAYKQAKKEIPGLKLIIGGKPTFPAYQERLERLAANDPDIIFAGFIPDEDAPAYYAAADVYTTATQWEGFDLPIPEAAACGTPTVAFDLCSHPEVTKNGILVPPKDTVLFANAIVKTIRNRSSLRGRSRPQGARRPRPRTSKPQRSSRS